MIVSLKGRLNSLNPAFCVVECNGVGYLVSISLMTFEQIKSKLNSEVYLNIKMIVRDDAHLLYGFVNKEEKDIFELLISVNGVGPSSAMIILSTLNHHLIVKAILNHDSKTLCSIKGIGNKTAQRIIIDLKDKITDTFIEDTSTDFFSANSQLKKDALVALEVLGIPKNVAEKKIQSILQETEYSSVEELVKTALRRI